MSLKGKDEEGLEQEFNTLQAQRESAEAYIRSQQYPIGPLAHVADCINAVPNANIAERLTRTAVDFTCGQPLVSATVSLWAA
jgi:hypothetical protein